MGRRAAFHWLRARATCHATERPGQVQEALATILDVGSDALGPVLEETVLASHYGGEVRLLEGSLTRARDIRAAVDRLIGFQTDAVADALEARLDEDLVLYLRFDKQAAAQGKLVPTLGEDAVQVRIKVQAHPATPENALAAWRDHLAQMGDTPP